MYGMFVQIVFILSLHASCSEWYIPSREVEKGSSFKCSWFPEKQFIPPFLKLFLPMELTIMKSRSAVRSLLYGLDDNKVHFYFDLEWTKVIGLPPPCEPHLHSLVLSFAFPSGDFFFPINACGPTVINRQLKLDCSVLEKKKGSNFN